MAKFKNLSGVKSGKLTAVLCLSVGEWLCYCDCGKWKVIDTTNFTTGHTKSCGCLKRTAGKNFATHGLSHRTEYTVWQSMLNRCRNTKMKGFENYVGRGISVCERWKEVGTGFTNFLSDLGDRPSKDYTLERINVNGNYEPSNCKWIHKSEQVHNRRATIKVWHKGKLIPLSIGLKELGLRQNIYHSKKTRKGLNDQEAFDYYVKPQPGFINHSFGHIT